MNENVDSMMIRLVGLALAVLMMAGMTIYTDLFKRHPTWMPAPLSSACRTAMWPQRMSSGTPEINFSSNTTQRPEQTAPGAVFV